MKVRSRSIVIIPIATLALQNLEMETMILTSCHEDKDLSSRDDLGECGMTFELDRMVPGAESLGSNHVECCSEF
jgi:hypothetical protein